MQKALKAWLYPRWSLGALATKSCYIILAIKMPHSCLPASFPPGFSISPQTRGEALDPVYTRHRSQSVCLPGSEQRKLQPSGQLNPNHKPVAFRCHSSADYFP